MASPVREPALCQQYRQTLVLRGDERHTHTRRAGGGRRRRSLWARPAAARRVNVAKLHGVNDIKSQHCSGSGGGGVSTKRHRARHPDAELRRRTDSAAAAAAASAHQSSSNA